MNNLFKNISVFAVLTVALSGFAACTRTTTAPATDSAGNTAGANTNFAAKTDYPPVSTGIMQSDIKDVDGGSFKLEDKKGKVLLVNLWATWCGPCRSEMPELIAMQNKFKEQGFEVVGLDADDESADEIKTFARSMKLNYQLGVADPKLIGEFRNITRMDGIPQSLLINREGKLTGIFLGGGPKVVNQMRETVEKIVNQ